jgi:hypothetical protein
MNTNPTRRRGMQSTAFRFAADSNAAGLNDDKPTQKCLAFVGSQPHERATYSIPGSERIAEQDNATMGRSAGVHQLPEIPVFSQKDAELAHCQFDHG